MCNNDNFVLGVDIFIEYLYILIKNNYFFTIAVFRLFICIRYDLYTYSVFIKFIRFLNIFIQIILTHIGT